MRINQNIMAFNSYRNLTATNNQLGKSLEKLSSGFRINRAADDAAGLVVSEGLRAQISGLRVATRNAQDGVSVVQTAEGALTEVHAILRRMRDLAVQASNTGANDADARAAAQAEIDELELEIDRISDKTKFGGSALLDGSYGKTPGQLSDFDSNGTVTFTAETFIIHAAGANTVTVTLDTVARHGEDVASYLQSQIRAALNNNATLDDLSDQVSVTAEASGAGYVFTIENMSATALTIADGSGTPLADAGLTGLAGTLAAATGSGGVFQVGANANETITVSIDDMDAGALGVDALDVENDADGAITLIDAAISTVSTQRGELGAIQNRFEHTVSNLSVTAENLAASESRIRDTDMALELVSFTRHQILQQAGTAMLAQANQVPSSVLSLLG